ncbi:MAG: RNA helicase [Anaerolineaceae bacterium]|nr:RNA helicase [Anaerolineaceae bacterium]
MSFKSFNFHPLVSAGIKAAGYETPTAIQKQTIPAILNGSDVLGLAQTGTGKTAAFVLPILQHLMKSPQKQLRALILSPTRELAEQTNAVIKVLGRKTGIRGFSIYGGVGKQPQINEFRNGTQIAVACPGRLLDLMNEKQINLKNIDILVLDEADQMFDMGFLPTIRRIIAAVPKQRQTLLFSATMPKEIRSLANDFLNNPVVIEIGHSKPADTVRHALYPVEQPQKMDTLIQLMDTTAIGQVLIFTRTKHRASKLAFKLKKQGFNADALQGNLSQKQRDKVMDRFRQGRIDVLVATDIASRGIDVTQVSHVINFDMPDTAEAYTHRIGRTGRMENQGMALSFVTKDDNPILRMIEKNMGHSIERREITHAFPQQQAHTSSPRSTAR